MLLAKKNHSNKKPQAIKCTMAEIHFKSLIFQDSEGTVNTSFPNKGEKIVKFEHPIGYTGVIWLIFGYLKMRLFKNFEHAEVFYSHLAC